MPTVKDVIVKKPTAEKTKNCRTWPVWTCGVSEFDWEYDQTETCLVLEGSVTVTDNPGGKDLVTFGPGDLVTFPQGLKCFWKVSQPVRKHYHFS